MIRARYLSFKENANRNHLLGQRALAFNQGAARNRQRFDTHPIRRQTRSANLPKLIMVKKPLVYFVATHDDKTPCLVPLLAIKYREIIITRAKS